MEIRGSFAELVAHAQALREGSDGEPLQLFVEDVAVITASTPALLCNESGGELPGRPADERYRYVLMLHQVQHVQRCWRERHGRNPQIAQACRAVMFYSDTDQHIAELPSQADEDFVWPVVRRRGELQAP
jgi:hypothetical protein